MKTVVKDDSLTPSLRPRLIYENGSPVEVILSLGEYLRLLEAIEDKEDIDYVEALLKEPMQFQDFENFMKKSFPGV